MLDVTGRVAGRRAGESRTRLEVLLPPNAGVYVVDVTRVNKVVMRRRVTVTP